MHLHKLPTSIHIGNGQMPFKLPVKNFGFAIDCIALLLAHMPPILLGHATLNCVVWHLFVDYRQVLQLPLLFLHFFCQELTTVSHCCLFLLMM